MVDAASDSSMVLKRIPDSDANLAAT
jgi:hypothetical protein